MKRPEEYTQLLHLFIESDHEVVKVTATRDDWIALTMAAYVLNLPVKVLRNSKTKDFLVLERKT